MKIAIIAHSAFPIVEPFAGGLEMITYQLVTELVKRGNEVDLYAHPDSCERLPLCPMLSEKSILTRYENEEIKYSGMTSGEFSQTMIYHDVMAKILNGGYDIVHNHSLHHVPILMGNTLGKRFITSLHTPAFIQLKLGFGALPVINQTITTVSNRLKLAFDGITKIDRTVYNGIDLNLWSPRFDTSDDYYFWMGRLCKEKAPHHAIEACLSSGKRLLLAGPRSDEEYFKEAVEPHLGNENIVYLGHLTHEEMGPILRNATAYLFTSVWEEPYGLTIAESLACATPVIAYHVGAAPEILTEDAGVLVEKGNIGGLVEAMAEAKTIDRRSCRARAEAFCCSTVMADRYLALYRDILYKKPVSNLRASCPNSPIMPIHTAVATAGMPILLARSSPGE